MTVRPPPVTGMARGLRLGRAAFEAGAQGVLERLAPGSTEEARGVRPSRVLMTALMELRGAALKVAQFLSLESDLLPEAVAREFAQACHRVPPMGPEFARNMVRQQIGPIERHFGSFESTPFASASLGQVHAATTLDGRAVAVKIQYPGMSESVRSDLRLLRRAAALLAHSAHYRRLLNEVEIRLLEECDYDLEAESIAWFRERLTVEGVSVPEVLLPLSASAVLTTTRMPGLHLDAWLGTDPDQEQRDRAGQRLYDVFVQSMHVLGRLHADPNPGNVLFDGEAHVGLIDFGCTRWIPTDYQGIVTRIWRAAIAGDDDAAHAVYLEMGLFAHLSQEDGRRVDQASLKPFRDWLATPFQVHRFDFGGRPDFIAEGRRRFVRMLEDDALVGIRPEFVLVNRTLYGLYRMFERLRARVHCQTAWTCG